MANPGRVCPHCGSPLRKWLVPEGSTWDDEYFLACFNDDCSYYKNGWEWMESQYGQRASFRYAFNPNSDSSLALPVWSDSATREMLVDDEEGNRT